MFKLFLVLIVGLAAQINAENLPVFLWGPKTPTYLPTLQHLESEEFVTLVRSQTDKDSLTVLFVENNLSVEDFSQCQLKTKTCFENLQNIPQKTFLNSVEDPVESLIASYNKKKSIKLSSEADLKDVDAENEKILIVNLDDVENPEDFDKHDELMNKLFNELKSKYGNVLAIYTGRHPSFKYSETLSRKTRDAEAAEEKPEEKVEEEKPAPAAAPKQNPVRPREENLDKEPDPFVLDSDPHVLLAISEFWVNGVNITMTEKPTYTVNIPEDNLMSMIVTLIVGTHNLVMNVTNSTGRWQVETFKYDNVVYYPKESHVYGFSAHWSFGCRNLTLEAPNMVLNQPRNTILLGRFQFQPSWEPRVPENNSTKVEFGPCNDCIGFFSAGIWGGLFVVIILLFILFYGICNMMDIRSMDRFDDPKGKTIIISAQE